MTKAKATAIITISLATIAIVMTTTAQAKPVKKVKKVSASHHAAPCPYKAKSIHRRVRLYIKNSIMPRHHFSTYPAYRCYFRYQVNLHLTSRSPRVTEHLITALFGPRAPVMRRIGWSESKYPLHGHSFGVYATNGQYEGVFQEGTGERRHWGWYSAGSPAYTQVMTTFRHSQGGRNLAPWGF